jgi:hypothetical protein
VRKTLTELVDEYGTVADHVVIDLAAQQSHYDDKTRTLHYSTCPMREIEPRYVKEVDEWLTLWENASRLKDWLAVSMLISRPCAALYVEGTKGAGKSLIAMGVSRLWTEHGPSLLKNVIGSWNDDLLKCPIVFADEVLPDSLRRGGNSGTLRSFIQETKRSLTVKHMPNRQMVGAARLILAANNESLLETDEHLTTEDIAAIAERYLDTLRLPPRAQHT